MVKIKLLEEAMNGEKGEVKANKDAVAFFHCSAVGHYARDCVNKWQGGQDFRNWQRNNNGKDFTGPGNNGHRQVNRAQNSWENHLN